MSSEKILSIEMDNSNESFCVFEVIEVEYPESENSAEKEYGEPAQKNEECTKNISL